MTAPSVVIVSVVIAVSAATVRAQDDELDVTLGTSALLLLGPMSGSASLALDAAASGPITSGVRWTGGVRLGVAPLAPEVFARASLAPSFGAYLPSVGLEAGIGSRAAHDSGDALLRDARQASRDELSPIHVGVHTAPLRFRVLDRWRVSFMELLLGSQLSPLGRFVRVQVQLVSVGVAP